MRCSTPLLLALSLLGCATKVTDTGSDDPPTHDAAGQPQTDSQASFVEAEGAKLPESSDAGLPDCPSDADADTYCTEAGKLAGRWLPVDRVHVPEDAQVLFVAEHSDIDGQPSLKIATAGSSFYILHVSCGACRRVMGQGFSGELGQLDETQLRAMQTKLGLRPDAPLLDSIEAWQGFVADPDGHAQLDELSRTSH